ncbi:hypothetical protein VN97_g6644 [Penicillium thymicola]|uniref:Uncharacterized protein n=1 Tax=Penicillium thymicola TaxID=293382 RepID=A0AAI9TH43_PENTH|nr:hypothetical protein VN97_g6644 [Penicillium thymicola]
MSGYGFVGFLTLCNVTSTTLNSINISHCTMHFDVPPRRPLLTGFNGNIPIMEATLTTPIQSEEFKKLYKYLCFGLSWPPFLEIYSYNPPDGLACVEHQRREIAHRKRLQAEQREGGYDESIPPLIPTMRTDFEDEFMSGFCFLLTSKSYLQGSFQDNDHGTGPWWINFDRSLPSAIKKLDMIKRLDTPPTKLQTFKEWGISVNPEIRDINVNITANQGTLKWDIKELMRGIYSTC